MTPHRFAGKLVTLGCALALAGCGSSHHDTRGPSASSAPSPVPSVSATTPPPAPPAAHPKPADYVPDWNLPLKDYRPALNNNALMFEFYAHAPKVDYNEMALHYSAAYRNAPNAAAKAKILKKLKPILKEKLAQAKAHPYIYLARRTVVIARSQNYPKLLHPMAGDLIDGRQYVYQAHHWVGRYFPVAINEPQLKYLKINDPKVVKQILKISSADEYNYFRFRPYVYVNGVNMGQSQLKVTCTAIQLYGPHKNQFITTYRFPQS